MLSRPNSRPRRPGRVCDGCSIALTGGTLFYEVVGEGRLGKLKEMLPF
ncbi:MAG: hypothetical protein HZA91_16525 [Verrucomicrobia bacterium]|nr:hypothetical protein [Verrucomicrobiota bacterium]